MEYSIMSSYRDVFVYYIILVYSKDSEWLIFTENSSMALNN